MLNPSETIHRWLCSARAEPPPHVAAAIRQVERHESAGDQHFIDWKIDDMERVVEASRQLHLALPEMNARDRSRTAVADYFDRVARPYAVSNAESKIGIRLRDSRGSFVVRTRRSDGKQVIMWDNKAGLKLLDPDDAREEAMRVQRRVVPAALEQLKKSGVRAYYGVFTMPNAPAGKLREAMRKLSKRFNALMRKVKRDGCLPIIGAYAVMESPMGWRRDWHPHLNVLILTQGWLDFAELRKLWHWNVELRRLEGSEDRLQAAMREIIKYSVRAVPEKSSAKAQTAERRDHGVSRRASARRQPDFQRPDGQADLSTRGAELDGSGEGLASTTAETARVVGHHNAPGDEADREGWEVPPALTDWRAGEFWEWIRAHKGFRRSRGYGCLYRVADPEPEDLTTGFETTHVGSRGPSGYMLRSALLESIPGDKSSTISLVDRYRRAIQRLRGHPDEARSALDLTAQAMQAWEQVKNQLP